MNRHQLVPLALLAAGVLALMGRGAHSQSAFPNGAFVLSQDGTAYIVYNGTAFPISFATDDTGLIPSLPVGATVATLTDIPTAIQPTVIGQPSQPAAQPTQAPAPSGGTRSNPLPLGSVVDLGDGWQVQVVSVTPNATSQVRAQNQFNSPPAAGHQFFIARVQATFTGAGSARFDGTYRLRAVGNAAVSYSTFADSCGVYPDPISAAETFTGGTLTGNVCWSIQSSDAGSLAMYDNSASASGRVYMALFR